MSFRVFILVPLGTFSSTRKDSRSSGLRAAEDWVRRCPGEAEITKMLGRKKRTRHNVAGERAKQVQTENRWRSGR